MITSIILRIICFSLGFFAGCLLMVYVGIPFIDNRNITISRVGFRNELKKAITSFLASGCPNSEKKTWLKWFEQEYMKGKSYHKPLTDPDGNSI